MLKYVLVVLLFSGGSKSYYKFVRFDNGAIFNIPDFSPWKRPENEIVQIPNGAACVTHSFYCGHDCGVSVILPKQNQLEVRGEFN